MSNTKKTNTKKKKKSTTAKKTTQKVVKTPVEKQEIDVVKEELLVVEEPVVEEQGLVTDMSEDVVGDEAVEDNKNKGIERRAKEIKAPRWRSLAYNLHLRFQLLPLGMTD